MQFVIRHVPLVARVQQGSAQPANNHIGTLRQEKHVLQRPANDVTAFGIPQTGNRALSRLHLAGR